MPTTCVGRSVSGIEHTRVPALSARWQSGP